MGVLYRSETRSNPPESRAGKLSQALGLDKFRIKPQPRGSRTPNLVQAPSQSNCLGAAVIPTVQVATVPIESTYEETYDFRFHDMPPPNRRTRGHWLSVMSLEPIEDPQDLTLDDDSSGSTDTIVPRPAQLTPTPSRVQQILRPIVVPAPTDYAHVQAVNPLLTVVVDPGTTPVASPTDTTHRLNQLIVDLDEVLESGRRPTGSTQASYHTAPDHSEPERRMLIIGSGYKEDGSQDDRDAPLISPAQSLSSLRAIDYDVNGLVSVFQNRGYIVETMIGERLARQQVLDRLSDFIGSAHPGDVRFVIFTGHAVRADNSSPMLQLPPRRFPDAIGPTEWNRTIRDHTGRGVIVISVLATCFAGGFVEGGQPLSDIGQIRQTEDFAALDTPVFITFGSSDITQQSHESGFRRARTSDDGRDEEQPPFHDHFLLALAKATNDRNVRSWDDFIRMLREYFYFARVRGAAISDEGFASWVYWHPQHPTVALPDSGELPPFHSVFPPRMPEVIGFNRAQDPARLTSF